MSNLTHEQVEEVRKRLIDFVDKNPGISNKLIGQNTGYSGTTINLFKNGKYPGSDKVLNELADKIENYLNNELTAASESVGKGSLKFALTVAAQDIFRISNYSLTEGKIGVVTGSPGSGKTIALKEYKRRNPTTIFIEVTPLVSPRILLEDLCSELNRPKSHVRNTMFQTIVNELRGTKRLLIIDEGENLNVSCLEVIRRIQDFTEVGMLLAGTSRLLNRLRGERRELQQLFSRVGIQKEIKLLQLGDIKAILQINFPEAMKFAPTFLSLSKNNGRLLQHLIALVKKTIQETGESISEDLIDDAAGSLLT
ncbi:MAG TPA: AAA family ATPase [Ignavibacteriaceae bacterium]|nr:AAA family ATPase [Ignavibacteriaceae bacterium]